jgi:hypothetical protein
MKNESLFRLFVVTLLAFIAAELLLANYNITQIWRAMR